MGADDPAQAVLAAITSRRSVRAYLPDAVPRPVIEQILTAAARAPSGTNMQPWRVHVLTGAAKARLTAAVMAERNSGAPEPPGEYGYYPKTWRDPYLARRRAVGVALYRLLGIAKGDDAGARAWHDQNFSFFGAPVGLIFTLDRDLEAGSYMDYGMFLQNIMIAARGLGLDTCPQAAFARYHAAIRRELEIPAAQIVLCGMALGWADAAALPNRFVTGREDLAGYAVFAE